MEVEDTVGEPPHPEDADTISDCLMRGGIAQNSLKGCLNSLHKCFTKPEMLLCESRSLVIFRQSFVLKVSNHAPERIASRTCRCASSAGIS